MGGGEGSNGFWAIDQPAMLYCTCTELELSSLPLPLTFPPQQPRHSHLQRYFTFVEHSHFFFIMHPSIDEWRQSSLKIRGSQVTSSRPLGCALKQNVSKIAPNHQLWFWLKLFRLRAMFAKWEKKSWRFKGCKRCLPTFSYEEYEVSHLNGIYPQFELSYWKWLQDCTVWK